MEGEGARASSPLSLRPQLCVWSNPKAATNVRRACRPLSTLQDESGTQGFQGHPYWCRQESRMVCCRNVQLMLTLFLKLTKIIMATGKRQIRQFQRPHSSLKMSQQKRLRISTSDLY